MTITAGPATEDRPRLASTDPRDDRTVGTVAVHDAADVVAAVARARTNQTDWGRRAPVERADHLRRIRARLALRAGELAELIASETGKPDFDAMAKVLSCGAGGERL